MAPSSFTRKATTRLVSTIALLLLTFTATRGLIRALPGDPLETLLAESGTTIARQELREELHLDEPFLPALVADLKNMAHGNLGVSIISHQPIAPLLARRLSKTFELTAFAAILTLIFSIALGLASVDRTTRMGRAFDSFCSVYGAVVSAMPTPWIGPLLMFLFCVWLPIFPLGDHVALPALTLSLSFTGFWARLIRERVRDTLITGAAPGARARGLPEWMILLKYGLAPCSGSLLAFFGTQVGGLMAGAFVTELIFNWPGMGDLLISAVLRRDYPVIEAAGFIAASAVLLGNLLGDLAQQWTDPRLRNSA